MDDGRVKEQKKAKSFWKLGTKSNVLKSLYRTFKGQELIRVTKSGAICESSESINLFFSLTCNTCSKSNQICQHLYPLINNQNYMCK